MVVRNLFSVDKAKIIKLLRSLKSFMLLLFLGIILAIIFRLFFVATFRIPTPSMEPAIISGDQIIVSKLIPGPRFFKNYKFLETNSRPDLFRLKGWRTVRRNDILVFNFPNSRRNKTDLDLNIFYVKRCIALPGDTFLIVNGVNRVLGNSTSLGDSISQQRLSDYLSMYKDADFLDAFPKNKNFSWTILNFGPLYIPKAGDRIELDSINIHLYKRLIEYESSSEVKTRNSQIYLGDSLITSFTFDTNYYFMAGDYVFDSRDSRYWGLLPEDHIVGKVSAILYSKDRNTGKLRWNRVLKFI